MTKVVKFLDETTESHSLSSQRIVRKSPELSLAFDLIKSQDKSLEAKREIIDLQERLIQHQLEEISDLKNEIEVLKRKSMNIKR